MSERRYNRPRSPPGGGRRMVNPARSSTGSFGYSSYDHDYLPPHISRDYPTSPRSSTEAFSDDRLPSSRVYQIDRPPTGHYYGGYTRPRRPTFDAEGDPRPRPVVSTGLRPIVHTSELEPSRDVIIRPGEHDADYGYYITSEASGRSRQYHQRNPSLEERNVNPPTGRRETLDSAQVRQPRTADYRGYGRTERTRGYHPSGSSAGAQQLNDEGAYSYDNYGTSGYSHPGAGDPYLERAPRRPRAGSLDTPRRERPLSMMGLQEYLPRLPSGRERGPPPSTRGIDRLTREPVGGYADPRYLVEGPGYEQIEEGGAAELSRRASKSGRHRPVSLHQNDYGHQLRHREDLSDDRERERERHHKRPHADQTERMHHAAEYGQHGHRSYDDSPDSFSEREEDTHQHRSHRHRRHRQEEDYRALSLQAGELPDRTLVDRHDQDNHSHVAREYDKGRQEHDTHKGRVRERENGRHENDFQLDSVREETRDRPPQERKTSNDRTISSNDREPHVRVVSPPREKEVKAPLKGILREPRDKFPEDPAPVREGVAPLKDALKDGRKGIPPGARWTKIDRRKVNPAALEEAHERFEERPDHVIVLRVLTREEIEVLAARTKEIRGK